MKLLSKKCFVLLSLSLAFIAILVGVIIKTVIPYTKVLQVETNVGPIRGYLDANGEFYNFLGIPYAMVNESMPFGESIEYPPFKHVYHAYHDPPMCPQKEEQNYTIQGSLDCLRLNIYVPGNASPDNRVPILVYVYGGRYKVGFSGRHHHGPKYLVKNDIILVTVNYRSGPYGFMCLDLPEVPGNQGLKDQIKALMWIKQNIAEFGGDPNKITLAGTSSGGEATLLHLVFHKEKLYNQAIIEGGISLTYQAVQDSNPSIAIRIADELGFKTTDVREALNFLTIQKSHMIIDASEKLNLKYSPCIEKNVNNAFITDYLTPSTQISNIEDTPILICQTKNENLFQYADTKFEDDKFQNIFKDKLNEVFDLADDRLQDLAARVRQFYIGDEDIGENVKQRLIDFLSDVDFNYPIRRFLKNSLATGAQKMYHNVLTYVGDRNYLRKLCSIDPKYKGATHSELLGYLFELSILDDNIAPEDELIVNRVTGLWANFVKYGDPVPSTTELLPVKCPSLTNDSLTYLEIDKEFKCGVNLFHNRMAYWDLFYEFNNKFERTRASVI